MAHDNTAMRKTWFGGFDDWQAKFNDVLRKIAASPSKAQSLGKTFLHDVMIPFIDVAKDRLLADIAKHVQEACEQAGRLDRLVNEKNM